MWREFAEHVAGSLTKGMRVIATGRLKQRSYQDREGNNRTAIELEVDEIGPSLRYATAQVTRAAGGSAAAAASAAVAVAVRRARRRSPTSRGRRPARPSGAAGGDAWAPRRLRRRHPF